MNYVEYPTEMVNSAAQGPHKQTQPTQQTRSTAEIEKLLAQFGRHTGGAYIAADIDIRELAYEGVGE